MVRIGQLLSDPDKEVNGVWVNYDYGIRLKIARIANRKYQDYLAELLRPYQLQNEREVTQTIVTEVTIQAMARHILIDWENLSEDDEYETKEDAEIAISGKPEWEGREPVEENGKWYVPMPYSEKKAIELLSDPRLHDLYRFILLTSNQTELFRFKREKELAKN